MRIFQFKTPLAWWVRFRKMAKSANDVDELSAIFEESSSSNNSIFDQIWRLLGSKRPPLFRAERENLWDHGNRGGVWLFKFRASNFITPSNLQILLAEMRRTKWMESVYGNMRLSLICSYRANTLPWRANTWTFMLISRCRKHCCAMSHAWLLNFGHVTRMIVELWTRERNVEHVRGFSHDLWNVNARDLSDQCDERAWDGEVFY